MARARNIKPGFFTHDGLADLEPLARLLFIGLWTVADRAGRIEDRPKRIRAEVMPYDECDVDAMLTALHNAGFILRYRVGDVAAIQIVKWDKHQNPHMKESDSTIPAPDMNGADRVQTPVKANVPEQPSTASARLIPDSGFPLPDSPISVPGGTGGASKPARRPPAIRKPDDVTERTWMDWQQLRRAKKAPVTETVVEGARKEAELAGLVLEEFLKVWCRRGSQGLEAAWLKPHERGSTGQAEPTWRTEQRERTQLAAPGVAVRQDAADFFDVEARNVTVKAIE
jgi:hypothetical protein